MDASNEILTQYVRELEAFIRAGYAERVSATLNKQLKHGIECQRKYEHLTIGEYERLTKELTIIIQMLPTL